MPEHSIFALVLAAGESRRFGSTKQLAKFGGDTLVGRAVRLAQGVCGERTVLVVGNDWTRVLAACAPLRGFFLYNDNHTSGMAGSIALGIGPIAHTADAILILMADQPLITADHLRSLKGAWTNNPDDIVVSEYAGIQGPPVIFPAQCFGSLAKLEGDQGARSLLSDYPVTGIPFDDAAADVNTPEDLAKLNQA
ncbi:MAG: NTP transferase domain-containing protein [Woeseia sp.]